MESNLTKKVLTITVCCILFSSLFMEVALSQSLQARGSDSKKKAALKILSIIAMVRRYTKPKKGILPIPLPLPVPLPIEWEQPPVVSINSIKYSIHY